MSKRLIKQDNRLTESQKNAKDKQWYKDKVDMYDRGHENYTYSSNTVGNTGDDDYKRMQVNFDLFNNILNLADFQYVCKPFGEDAGELPANMVNRDIISGKIKALLGMEMKRPFSWNIVATNPEATTQREKKETDMLKEYVTQQIMQPIKDQIMQGKMQELQQKVESGEVPEEQAQQMQQQMQQEVEQEAQAMTPDEVKRYMSREYQDPSEVLASQILEYLKQEQNLREKFNKGMKYSAMSAREIYYVGNIHNKPSVINVNPMRFDFDKAPDSSYIEDGEWASCEYRMTPSETVSYFSDSLKQKEIDDIYNSFQSQNSTIGDSRMFDFSDNSSESNNSDDNTIRVLHVVFKSLRKIGFLTYLDEEGGEQEMLVFDGYTVDEDAGDIEVKWEWIPEVYEGWKIGTDIYKNLQPVPGQFKDLDNLHHCKLPYIGAVIDDMNSQETSIMDRLKQYQYYYNIIMYRIELLIASDKGKKVMMNINAIPDSAGMDMEKWQYFFESSPFMWYDPNEEGTGYNDVNTMAKQIDLSLASDINRYVELAEYVKRQAGTSIGITEQVEGQIGPNDAVSNTRQSLIQSSHILEPYFEVHNNVKKNVLTALLETAKVIYATTPPDYLVYVLDDMSKEMLKIDADLLDNSSFGIFVTNSAKAEEAKDLIRQLSHAALQNQRVELSDVISVLRQEGIVEAEETLKLAEDKRAEQANAQSQQQNKHDAEMAEKAREFQKEEWANDKEDIILKEEEKRKTEIIKANIMAASFNPDEDKDNDGQNDFVEAANKEADTEVKRDKQNLDREKFDHQKQQDKEKNKLEEKKIKASRQKQK